MSLGNYGSAVESRTGKMCRYGGAAARSPRKVLSLIRGLSGSGAGGAKTVSERRAGDNMLVCGQGIHAIGRTCERPARGRTGRSGSAWWWAGKARQRSRAGLAMAPEAAGCPKLTAKTYRCRSRRSCRRRNRCRRRRWIPTDPTDRTDPTGRTCPAGRTGCPDHPGAGRP